MMGRQVRFYTFPSDEISLIDFVFSIPATHFIMSKTSQPVIETVDRNTLLSGDDPNFRHLYIWSNKMLIPKNEIVELRMVTYNEELMDFVETGEIMFSVSTHAPVVEFSRSFLRDDNKLVQGRIWCEFYRLNDDRLEYKGDDFTNFYEQIANWIRKNFKKLKGIDGYFGKEALEWYKSGGELFP
ncbi:MAG: hypothetical protein ROW48_13705 [Bellilinea sp.]